ncbi:hypothetical protein LJR225_003470 [Phenylobacterium sp. LjRoot225]|uniref:hypothetical protein n=1 Tax=Phenylobacterium sp. LjRoot225 TaxID=3342285 RepID=UPI003ECF9162
MDEGGKTTGRTALLGQLLQAWRVGGEPPTWEALRASAGGLGESLCLIRWPGADGDAVIAEAGAQAVLAYGSPLTGEPVQALTSGRRDAVEEASQARALGEPFTAEDAIGGRRVARLYLPLDEAPPAVACAVIRID